MYSTLPSNWLFDWCGDRLARANRFSGGIPHLFLHNTSQCHSDLSAPVLELIESYLSSPNWSENQDICQISIFVSNGIPFQNGGSLQFSRNTGKPPFWNGQACVVIAEHFAV